VEGFSQNPNVPLESNRARASSTVSLPSISHTAEEFSVDQKNIYNTPQRYPYKLGAFEEDTMTPSVTGLSTVFRESPLSNQVSDGLGDRVFGESKTTSLGYGASTSAFGEPVVMRKRAGTDFIAGNNTAFSNPVGFTSETHYGDLRNRASTWGEPSIDMFGLGLFGENKGGDQNATGLADDLAAILKLSGSEPKNDLFAPPGF
jgi:hypothetical protein